MSHFSTCSVLVLAATAFAAQPRFGAAPSGFEITSIAFSGTGCSSGAVVSHITGDKQSATAIFSEFIASAGPDVAKSENHKDCLVSLSVKVPEGFNFGLKGIETGGYVELDQGVSAMQTAIYSFGGSQATSQVVVSGPAAGQDVALGQTFSSFGSVRSPCGGDTVLKIVYDLLISGTGAGVIAKDSLDLRQAEHFDWKTC